MDGMRGVPILLLLPALALAQAEPPLPAEFTACLAELRTQAQREGITNDQFDVAMSRIEPDQTVIVAMGNQPEFSTPIWQYMAGLVDDKRIAEGQAQLKQWNKTLERAEKVYGVDRYTVVAVWGVESNYGKIMGKRPLVRSLVTASCYGKRQAYFRGELVSVLKILGSGDIEVDLLKGSWAGAFGHTQFMPSTFQRLAVDFDGDGRRDVVSSVPDALGSTANYLKQAGWQSGQPWGYEVRIPAKYTGPSGRRTKIHLDDWVKHGIQRVDGKPLLGDAKAALLLPAGARGPAFLALRNYDAIYSYNTAESYALAIAHLSDRLRGGKPFRKSWPTDDPGLSRSERFELQERLALRGYDVGEADGLIGPRTIDAVKAFQVSEGVAPDGYAGQRVLKALRKQ
ncbi:Tn3 family transposase TnXax1 [Usitatibacter rugosus]|uniref:Tn3 family transposase TnXax1 n=2 Tax=Usitatibacter rugosus TaxID=2732067 RepID=A0A6M4H2J3_9PROT|nr:Tn3 family transposase TnXax1 [Usitatibacter rugosus]